MSDGAPTPVPGGWEGLLDPGETILWQGRPAPDIRFHAGQLLIGAFGFFFAAFALFWMALAAQAGGFFWMFGLLHFSVGIGIMLADPIGGAFLRRHTWYTLTSKRGFIATDLPLMPRRLKSYPILPDTPLILDDLGRDLANVHFAAVTRRGRGGTYKKRIGFEMIADGQKVFALIRTVQRGAA